jgi:hypothetical protein
LSLLIRLTPKLCKKISQSLYTPYILEFFTGNYTPYIKEWREYYDTILTYLFINYPTTSHFYQYGVHDTTYDTFIMAIVNDDGVWKGLLERKYIVLKVTISRIPRTVGIII